MSLLNEMMTSCVFVNKTKTPDGEGGFTNSWTEGDAEFKASIIRQSSTLATIAEAIKEKRAYTITVDQSVALEYGDVIKRLSDGATFKVTSGSAEMQTPASSTLNIAQVSAERWDLA